MTEDNDRVVTEEDDGEEDSKKKGEATVRSAEDSRDTDLASL